MPLLTRERTPRFLPMWATSFLDVLSCSLASHGQYDAVIVPYSCIFTASLALVLVTETVWHLFCRVSQSGVGPTAESLAIVPLGLLPWFCTQ